jgi:hypothetical protein
MPKLVAVQLETCHANTDGTAWYAYLDGPTTLWAEMLLEIEEAAKKDGAPLGVEIDEDSIEEVPNSLSRHTGLKRYYVGAAV